MEFKPAEWVALAAMTSAVVTALLAWIANRQLTTTRRQLRAYINIDPGNVIRDDEKQVLELQPYISNAGSTPAFEVRNSSTLAILPFPLPPSTKLPLDPHQGSVMTLGPGQTRVLYVGGRCFSAGELKTIDEDKELKLYVYGRIQYFDTFQSPRWLCRLFPRYTNFCYCIVRNPNGDYHWIQSERHNDTN